MIRKFSKLKFVHPLIILIKRVLLRSNRRPPYASTFIGKKVSIDPPLLKLHLCLSFYHFVIKASIVHSRLSLSNSSCICCRLWSATSESSKLPVSNLCLTSFAPERNASNSARCSLNSPLFQLHRFSSLPGHSLIRALSDILEFVHEILHIVSIGVFRFIVDLRLSFVDDFSSRATALFIPFTGSLYFSL